VSRPEEGAPGANPNEESTIATEILAYLADHPGARDTWEGIVEWWLLEQKIQRESRRVARTLEHLVEEGLVSRRQGPDGRAHYALNAERAEEVRRRLGRGEEGS